MRISGTTVCDTEMNGARPSTSGGVGTTGGGAARGMSGEAGTARAAGPRIRATAARLPVAGAAVTPGS
ncbi:hypothetical protein GCM10010504_24740 [Streptomyces griseus]|nr:hypothetical protein GCM10010504_24740 [Streptomyces griseus]